MDAVDCLLQVLEERKEADIYEHLLGARRTRGLTLVSECFPVWIPPVLSVSFRALGSRDWTP